VTDNASTPLTPQDVLADGAEGTSFDGTYIRKGTVAAFIGNVRRLDAAAPGSAEHQAVAAQIHALAPALEKLGIFDVFALRDPRVSAIVSGTP
jgi:hypothetical protein